MSEYDADDADDGSKPGRPSRAMREAAMHEEALQRFHIIQSALLHERRLCLKDRRFCQLTEAQWEGEFETQFANKPRMVVNMMRKAINDVCDDYRSSQMDVVFTRKDGAPDDGLADTCASLHRSDMQDSVAGEALYNAFKEAACGGFGGFRLRTRYEDPGVDEDENQDPDEPQRIAYEIIVDADTSLYFDLDAKRQDKSDAQYAFLVTSMTYEAYKAEYGDDPATWPKAIGQYIHDWYTPKVVYRAEYFVKEWQSYTEHVYRGLSAPNEEATEETYTDEDFEADKDLALKLEATGFREVRAKKRKRCKVHKWFLSGNAVLKDCGYIAGSEIPLIPVYGQRAFIENVERCSGIVRDVVDLQRLLNVLISKLVEINAYSPVEVPIFFPEQVAGHENRWKNNNVTPYAYHLVNALKDPATGQIIPTGAIGYTKAPTIPQATAVLIQLVQQFLKDIMRTGTDNEKVKSHVSGAALEVTQTAIDRKSSEYIDNMALGVERGGHVWLSIAKDVYGQAGRKLKGIGKRKELSQIELKKPMIGSDEMPYTANDLTRAQFDVAVDVGPSSQSRRDAIVRTMLSMLPAIQDPKLQSIIGFELVMHLQAEGNESLSKYARSELVKMGVETATEEEAQQLAQQAQNAKPSPQDQYALAAAQSEQADAAKAEADTALIAARTKETMAKTIETLAGIPLAQRAQAESEAKTLSDAHLAHKASAVSTAQTLHGMLPEAPTAPGTDGSGQ